MKYNIILSTCLLIIFTFEQTILVNCTSDASIDPIADTSFDIISNQNDTILPPLISELNKKLTVCEELKSLNDEKIQEFCNSTEYRVFMKCVEYNRKKLHEQKHRMKRYTDCDLDDCDQDDICDSNVCQNSCRSCTNNCNKCESCSRCTTSSCCHRHCRRQCTTSQCRSACKDNCVNKQPSQPAPSNTVTNTNTDTRTDTHTSNTTVLNSYNLTTAIKFTNYINSSNIVDIPIAINTTNINNISLTEQVSKQSEPEPLCCYITTPTECVNITVAPFVQCVHRRYKVCGPQCFQQPPPPPPQPPVVIRVPYGIPQPYTIVQRVPIPQPFPVYVNQPVRVPIPQPIVIPQPVPQPIMVPQPVPQPVVVPQPVPQPIVIPQPVQPQLQYLPQPIIQYPRPSCPLCAGGGCQQQAAGLVCAPQTQYYGGVGNYPINLATGNYPIYGSGGAYQVLYSSSNLSNPLALSPQTIAQPIVASPYALSQPASIGTLGSAAVSSTANQNIFNTAGTAYTIPAGSQFGGYAYGGQLGGYAGGGQLGGYAGGVQYSTDQLASGYVAGAVPQYTTNQLTPGSYQYITATGNQTIPINTLPGMATADQSNGAVYQYAGANFYPGTSTYYASGISPANNGTSTDVFSNTARPYGLHQFSN